MFLEEIKKYNSAMAQHEWDFDELERLQAEHIRKKVEEMNANNSRR